MITQFSKIGLIIVLLANIGKAQEIVIEGTVTDRYNQPLYNAHVYIETVEAGVTPNAKGKYSFYYEYTGPTHLICSHTGYETQTLVLDDKLMRDVKKGTLTINFMLEKGTTILPEFVHTDAPDTVYGTQQHSVSDFEFYNSNYILLTYEKRLKKGSRLLLADYTMQVIDDYEIPYAAVGLERDFANNVILVCEDRVYEVQINNDRFELLLVNKQDYEDLITPIVDTTNGQILFSTFTEQFPAFDYNSYNIPDSTVSLIRQVADKFMLELCRAEYKYLDGYYKNLFFNWEVKTGIDKEVFACMAVFEDGLYYDPLYAPMFVTNDTILIFDHYDNTLYKYDLDQNPLDSVPIAYHEPEVEVGNEFEQLLVRDEVTGDVYAVFQRPGGLCYLKEINLQTGEVNETYNLTFDYPEQVQVKNGSAYYIYRPFESLQKKYLYRERLD